MDNQEAKKAAIDRALLRIDGVQSFLTKREFDELPSILWEDELPRQVITGRYNNGTGILVATDQRLVFVDKGIMSLKVEDFPYDRISSVESKRGMIMGGVTIYAAGNKEEISQVPKDQVGPFVDWLRVKIREPKQAAPAAPTPAQPLSVADELVKLAGLRDQGILTDAEFEAQKSRLLG